MASFGHYYEKKAVYVQKKCISLVDLDMKRGRMRKMSKTLYCLGEIMTHTNHNLPSSYLKPSIFR